MKTILITIVCCGMLFSCKQKPQKMECTDEKCKSSSTSLTCSLSTPELQLRKSTILKSLRSQVKEKKELENGYSYKFPGHDAMIDELTAFIKAERQCCSFFTFNVSVKGDSLVWLDITGPDGAKEFIVTELEM